MVGMVTSWQAVVKVDGEWSNDSVFWPDEESAWEAGKDLQSRWLLVAAHATLEAHRPPNRPSWAEWIKQHGMPPKRVSL